MPISESGRSGVGDSEKFKLLTELGRGGMATVYLAVARGPAGFNKLLVVKRLRAALAAESEFRDMFLAEAKLAARINHPNVVQTNEVGFDGQFYYIVMEYIEGPSLASVVRKAGADFPVGLHIHIIVQALAGMHHAHELKDFEGQPLNVVHRDVSPQNIMVSYDGQVKLVDFGIAKAADSVGDTRTGVIKGKCAYMAAEQFGNNDVDRRADVFAAGVCLWQALTKRKLWKGLPDAEILSRVSRGEIPSPVTVAPDLPEPLVGICMRALAHRAEDRFATAAAFLGALEDFVSHHPEYRATNRDVTNFVTALFAAERTAMQTNIDEQLRGVTRVGASDVLFPSEAHSEPFTAATSAQLTQKKRLHTLFVAAAVVVAVASVGIVAARMRARPTASVAATTTQANVTIRARPETARLFFDDAPLAGNPAAASFTRDGLSHRVRAEAPGFARKTELIVLDSANVSIDMELDSENGDKLDPAGDLQTAATLEAVPPGAHLYLDGTLLPTNPSTAKCPRDGRAHDVKAEAAGFLPKTRKVTFDAPTVTVTLTLDKDPKASKAAVAQTPAPVVKGGAKHVDRAANGSDLTRSPVVTSPSDTAPPASSKKKEFDRGDPWGS